MSRLASCRASDRRKVKQSPRISREHAFTLVELMIAVSVIATLMSGVYVFFLRYKATSRLIHDGLEMEQRVRMISNALRRDLRTSRQISVAKDLIIIARYEDTVRYRVDLETLSREVINLDGRLSRVILAHHVSLKPQLDGEKLLRITISLVQKRAELRRKRTFHQTFAIGELL